MKKNKKIEQAKESLEDILRRIGPYLPKPRESKKTEEPQWKIPKGTTYPNPKHNQVTSPF